MTSFTERVTVRADGGDPIAVELASSIVTPILSLGAAPSGTAPWRRRVRPADDRYRYVSARAGGTVFTLHLDPVTTPSGWQLDRNHHWLTAERDGRVLHDEVIQDSALHTAVHHAVATLLADAPLPDPDLGALRRIARIADLLRAADPLTRC